MVLPFFFPADVDSAIAGPEETKNQRGKRPPPDSDPFSYAEFGKIPQAWQDKLLPDNPTTPGWPNPMDCSTLFAQQPA
jgi:hypothetical protein